MHRASFSRSFLISLSLIQFISLFFYCACLDSCILRCSRVASHNQTSREICRRKRKKRLRFRPPVELFFFFFVLASFQLKLEAAWPWATWPSALRRAPYHMILTFLYDITKGWFPLLGIFAQAFCTSGLKFNVKHDWTKPFVTSWRVLEVMRHRALFLRRLWTIRLFK